MASKSKAEKVAAAQAAAAQPLRVTDVEFALLKLRESFVEAQVRHAAHSLSVIVSANAASQPLLSTAVAELFKKKFGLASSGEDPDWFVKLRECVGRSMQPFMTLHGPWDMCVKTLRACPALFDPPRSYTLFGILQSEFTKVVLHGLTLSGAEMDEIRFKLECLIADVLVTRNWVAHETLSVEEVKRGMQSLVDTLTMLKCDPSLLPPVRSTIEGYLREIDDACAPGALPLLSIGSLARLYFMRNSQRLCAAVGERHDVGKAIERMAKGDTLIELQKVFVVKSRHDLQHGKSNGKSLSVMVALCSVLSLLRNLSSTHAFPNDITAAADACDADAMQLLARMQLCKEQQLLQAVSLGHQAA